MTYASHLTWGVVFGVVLFPRDVPRSFEELAIFVGWVMISATASLLPDIDHPKSWVGQRIPYLPRLLYRTTGHRGMTHSIFATAVLTATSYYSARYAGLDHAWSWFIAYAAFTGYVSHLAGDFITNRGISLLWPLPGRVGVRLLSTGSSRERFITGCVAVGGAFAFCSNYFPLVDYLGALPAFINQNFHRSI